MDSSALFAVLFTEISRQISADTAKAVSENPTVAKLTSDLDTFVADLSNLTRFATQLDKRLAHIEGYLEAHPATTAPAGQPARLAGPSVAEVNRALLEGSLLLSQSGLPVVEPRVAARSCLNCVSGISSVTGRIVCNSNVICMDYRYWVPRNSPQSAPTPAPAPAPAPTLLPPNQHCYNCDASSVYHDGRPCGRRCHNGELWSPVQPGPGRPERVCGNCEYGDATRCHFTANCNTFSAWQPRVTAANNAVAAAELRMRQIVSLDNLRYYLRAERHYTVADIWEVLRRNVETVQYVESVLTVDGTRRAAWRIIAELTAGWPRDGASLRLPPGGIWTEEMIRNALNNPESWWWGAVERILASRRPHPTSEAQIIERLDHSREPFVSIYRRDGGMLATWKTRNVRNTLHLHYADHLGADGLYH